MVSVEIGPLSERDEPASWTERYARFFLVPWFVLFDHAVDQPSINYDREDNVLRLHGVSESPGDEYNRAFLLSMPVVLSYSVLFCLVGVLPAGLISVLIMLAITPAILGLLDVWKHCSIYDHTHAKIETEAVEELQQKFAADEIDQEEFNQRLDQEFEA